MENKVRKIYEGAIKNERFLNAIKIADNDEKPSIFAENNEKVLFATIYYGWLVAKYGILWEMHI